MSPASPQLFISYRREDTAGHAGRLYDAIGIQCLLIVGMTLVTLQLLSGQRKPATA